VKYKKERKITLSLTSQKKNILYIYEVITRGKKENTPDKYYSPP